MFLNLPAKLPALIGVLLAIGLVSCAGEADAETPLQDAESVEDSVLPRMHVDVAEVRRENMTETLELTGFVNPWDVFLISSEIMGTVSAIHQDQGDWVKKGDLLLELDRAKLELRLKSSKADLKRARVELEFAEKHLQRARALLTKGAISQSDVDSLDERVSLAQAAVDVAGLAVESVQEELQDTRLFSPASGQISRRSVSLGETVTPGAVLFELIQLKPIKVLTEITDSYLAEVRTGQAVQLEFDAFPEKRFTGVVHKVHPVASQESGAFPLEIRLSNSERRLQPGMLARIALTGKVFADALIVPLESVVNTEGRDYVFVVEDGLAYRKWISIRERIGNWAIVDADLEPGQKVVTRGNSNLTDGTPVELIV